MQKRCVPCRLVIVFITIITLCDIGMGRANMTSQQALPIKFVAQLEKVFLFPQNDLFGQVAIQIQDIPTVRTMKLWNITEKGNFVLLTNTASQKWSGLETNNNISICFVDFDQGIQLIVTGKAELLSTKTNRPLLEQYWPVVSPGIQEVYHISEGRKLENIDTKKVSDNFGGILVSPTKLEILDIEEPYRNSERLEFVKSDEGWVEKQLNPL